MDTDHEKSKNADALARLRIEENKVLMGIVTEEEYCPSKWELITTQMWSLEEIGVAQAEDLKLTKIKRDLEGHPEYFINGRVLYKARINPRENDTLMAPRKLDPHLLALHHDVPIAGYEGQAKTLAALRKRFYWSGMSKDVKEYCRSCVSCNIH